MSAKEVRQSPDQVRSAEFIWSDPRGSGRNLFRFFLKSFDLASVPASVPLHLFADSLYRLRVNGRIIGYGPARFAPMHPEYDTYNLAPWLVEGRNSILVEVHSRGVPCYQAAPGGRGGFIAWGGCGSVRFSTPGDWKVHVSPAFDPDAVQWSFAQGPVECLDAGLLPSGYPAFESGSCADPDWRSPERCEAHWGALSPRCIAMPTLEVLVPQKLVLAAAIATDGQRVGFNVRNDHTGVRQPFFTHIHSPSEQDVTIGLFWGPIFLNGKKLDVEDCGVRGNRQNARCHLRAGWNFLYGAPALLRSFWTWLMEFPPGVRISALPEEGCPHLCAVAPHAEQAVKESLVPPVSSLAEIGNPMEWRFLTARECRPGPAREMAWDVPERILLRDAEPDRAIHLATPGEAATIVLDFGEEYLGHFEMEFETACGATIDIGFDERLNEAGTINFFRCHHFINAADRMVCGPGKHAYSGFHERGGRYVQITFRNHPGDVWIHASRIVRTTGEHRVIGRFCSSDPVFNWTWDACVKTLRASMSDGWIDPWRERGMYVGDTLVEAHAARMFTDDWRMEPWAIRLWARSQFPNGQIPDVVPSDKPSPLCDYTLIWVILLRNWWSATGDIGILRELWPHVERVFRSDVWREADGGLWEVHENCEVYIDYAAMPDEVSGVNGALNAFRIRALECAAEMAQAIGFNEECARYHAEALQVKSSFRRILWSSENCRFAACLKDARLSDQSSLHVNTLALAFGLADEGQEAGVLAYLVEALENVDECRPGRLELYFLYYLIAGLYRVEEEALAEGVIRDFYGIMKNRGAWTLWESLEWGLASNNSLCHGWAASPIVFFAEKILGVSYFTPGDPSHLLIAPGSATLDYAEGIVPHPDGPVHVEWKIDGKRLLVSTRLPKGVHATLRPSGRLSEFELEHRTAGGECQAPVSQTAQFS